MAFSFLQGLKAVATRFNYKTGYPTFLLGILSLVQLEFLFQKLLDKVDVNQAHNVHLVSMPD
jgi:C4-dicarboxylate transporter